MPYPLMKEAISRHPLAFVDDEGRAYDAFAPAKSAEVIVKAAENHFDVRIIGGDIFLVKPSLYRSSWTDTTFAAFPTARGRRTSPTCA